MAQRPQHESAFERIAQSMTRWAGSTGTFLAAIALILTWLLTGPSSSS